MKDLPEMFDPLAHLEKKIGRVDGCLGVFFRDCEELRSFIERHESNLVRGRTLALETVKTLLEFSKSRHD